MRLEASLLALILAMPASASDLVVRAGRAFDGERFVEGPVSLTLKDGRISADAPAPGALVIDAPALTVLPGLVDLRSGAGLPSWAANEERSEITPGWHALDALDAHAVEMDRALRGGVTTIVVSPGGRNVVGGLASAVKTDDRALRERIVAREAALVVALGLEPALGNRTSRFQEPYGLRFRRPGNRMGVVADVRKAAFDARRGAPGDESEALRRVLAGSLPAWFLARREADLRTALTLGRELGVTPVLLEPFEAHRMAGELAAAGVRGAVVGPEYQLPRGLFERLEGQDARAATPSILRDAGIPVALATGLDDDPGSLRDRAALAVRSGLPREAALQAITSVPARLLGLGHRLGTLKPGADGDLVLLDGDPLSPATRVAAVVVDGRVAFSQSPCPAPEPLP